MPHPPSPRTAPTGPWIRRFGAADGAVPLVCFPHAGGSAGSYLPLAKQLTPHVETWAVQYPGRQERYRETPFTEVTALADAAFTALRPHLTGPYAFFGHSMGALVAFEVARRCEAETGHGPVRLFASARRAPSVPHRGATGWRDDDALVAELERLGGTIPGALDDPDLRAMVLPVLRADYRAVEGYVCAAGATVGCPLTVLCGDRDPVVTVAETDAWRPHTTGAFDVTVHPGGHFYLDARAAEVAAGIIGALTGPTQRL
ncbi:thioesterase II family protein [Streptomyces catenulae]|uniref:Alpha/beta fold hydrolase n=1 Tax=Streptomyces catenulae TaxID=66875 RepID=A0ABV2Z7C7_9ACTN|nr:alpha/beta fold hydrolase [Streptomyces catenulae]